MGRVAGIYTIHTSEEVLASEEAKVFLKDLESCRVVCGLKDDLNMNVNGESQVLIGFDSLSNTMNQKLLIAEHHPVLPLCLTISCGTTLVAVDCSKFEYVNGVMNLQLSSKIGGPEDFAEVLITDLTSGVKRIIQIRAKFKPMLMNISAMSKEAQFYLRLEEICAEDNFTSIVEDAWALSILTKDFVFENIEKLGFSATKYLGKTMRLDSLTASVLDERNKEKEDMEEQLKEMIGSVRSSFVELVIDMYQKSEVSK